MNALYKSIIWDWNGTLFNDIDYNYGIVAKMLKKRGVQGFDKKEYRGAFCFPIIDFYKKVGFDVSEPSQYRDLVEEYGELYDRDVFLCEVEEYAVEAIDYLNKKGMRQYLLSGLNECKLKEQVEHYGIDFYFDSIIGSSKNDASDKMSNALELISTFDVNMKTCLMVGDTVYDAQIADCVGCDVVLYSRGHQDKSILMKTGKRVMDSLKEIMLFFVGEEKSE